MALVKPHGKKKKLMPLLLSGAVLQKELKKAKTLKQLKISSRETADLVMMGIGAFTPLTGFMTKKDWKGVCDKYKLADGTFWPVPVTLSASVEFAGSLKKNEEITLVDDAGRLVSEHDRGGRREDAVGEAQIGVADATVPYANTDVSRPGILDRDVVAHDERLSRRLEDRGAYSGARHGDQSKA